MDKFERAVLDLAMFPYRGGERKVGAYAEKDYRQLFIDNFTAVYRINETNKEVLINCKIFSKQVLLMENGLNNEEKISKRDFDAIINKKSRRSFPSSLSIDN